ncbi:hypothetical protein STANM309S_04528 [Streptomyces tanashiensis]
MHGRHRASRTAARASAPGVAWVTRMRRFAVKPPYRPAITTHTRKKIWTRNPVGSSAIRDQISPAARKPL